MCLLEISVLITELLAKRGHFHGVLITLSLKGISQATTAWLHDPGVLK
jgi:hypothetical protein